MKCYRVNCKEDCNDLKVQYCINRINKEQFDFMKKTGCKKCGSREVKVKYNNKIHRLCTSCGRLTRKGKVIKECNT